MLIVLAVGPGVVPYFTDGRHPGRWSDAAGRLLGLEGPVAAPDLRSVLEGCDPATGRYLPRRRPHRRRGGWDMVFGAPKSVSLLAATTGPDHGRSVAEAHTAAVGGVVGFLEARLRLWRCGPDGEPRPAEGLVAAAFDHRVNAAAEPHLHTHLLVANLSRSGGEWGPVRTADWFVGRAALAALYQMELRHQLYRRGWELDWRLRPDGLADLADVPRAAVRAASSQGRVAGSAGRFAARRSPVPQPWESRVAEVAGADGGPPGGPLGRPGPASGAPPSLEDPALERAVAIRLAGRRSDFRADDVLVALAACHAGGATAGEAAEWAERFCARSRPVRSPTAGPRWTTEVARRTDEELRRLVEGRTGEPVPRDLVGEVTPGRAGSQEEAVRALTTTAAGVHFLGAPAGRTDILAQAEVLLACREVWERAGRRVAVASPTAEAARRWLVLAGLAPYRRGDRVDVLVVDQADRRTSADLARLARGCGARLIFVEGGTLPCLSNPASHGLEAVAGGLGRLMCPPPRPWVPSPELAPGSVAARSRAPGPPCPGDGMPVGRAAAGDLLARWQAADGRPLLVGLGLEEVRELNRAARRSRLGDLPPGLAAGDRVVVLGRRPGLAGYGVFGTVTEAPAPGAHQGDVDVAWEDGTRTRTADRWVLNAIGYGYAVTPAVAARTAGPVMVLGPASGLGRARERVVAEIGPGLEAPGLDRAATDLRRVAPALRVGG